VDLRGRGVLGTTALPPILAGVGTGAVPNSSNAS
jgi:hypothetical protein